MHVIHITHRVYFLKGLKENYENWTPPMSWFTILKQFYKLKRKKSTLFKKPHLLSPLIASKKSGKSPSMKRI